MARSGNFQITGNELQAMVNENLLGLKAGQSIPATNRCLTRAEVANRVHVYTGDSPDGGFIPNSSFQDGANFSTGPWDAPGYGFLEVSANGTLISNQQIFKPFNNTSSTLQSLSYTFTVQANTNYYIKAYSLITYEYYHTYSTTSANDACTYDCNGNEY